MAGFFQEYKFALKSTAFSFFIQQQPLTDFQSCRVSPRQASHFCFGKSSQNHVGRSLAPCLRRGKLFGCPCLFVFPSSLGSVGRLVTRWPLRRKGRVRSRCSLECSSSRSKILRPSLVFERLVGPWRPYTRRSKQ